VGVASSHDSGIRRIESIAAGSRSHNAIYFFWIQRSFIFGQASSGPPQAEHLAPRIDILGQEISIDLKAIRKVKWKQEQR
jgi:hypothetical protein